MTPSARLSAAAAILDTLDLSRLVEPQLRQWAREHRFAGSGDRRAIADRVYTCIRRRRSAAALGGEEAGRALVLGSLIAEDGWSLDQIEAACSGGYGLAPLNDAERAVLSSPPNFPSDAARLDWPDWLYPEAEAVFGLSLEDELDALRRRAPLDLRVNTLRATVSSAQAALNTGGVVAERVPGVATALRLPPGTSILQNAAYLEGLIEPQDASSQAVALFAGVKPGQTVLDYCAGAGGKTVALAAAMDNQGRLLAHDVEPKRMADLDERAQRCGATIIRRVARTDLTPELSDAVFVDAPCSGSGSWRRDPLGKWRLTPERLFALHMAQRDALETAAQYVRPGGTLTYATCSVLGSENDRQADWFAELHSEYVCEARLALWPARDSGDGFFAARFRRQSP